MSPTIGTSTPAELIPGNPGSLEETARELAASGSALGLAAKGLSRIDTSAGWSGQAAEAFRKVFDNQPGKWKTAADAFEEASGALLKYASELEWAQGQAAAAIRTWNSGDHDSAQRTLNNARSALSSAAGTASRAIGHARDLAPPKPGWLSELGHDIEDVASDVWHGAVNLSEDVVDALASYGNAIVHDLGADLETAFGIWLIGAGLAGEFVGTALDVTVVLSPGGAAINLASAVPIAVGGGIATGGLIQLSKDAAGPDRVSMARSSDTGGSGGGSGDDPNFGKLKPAEQDTLVRLQGDRPDLELKAAEPDRNGADPGHEYVDKDGKTYDQIGDPKASTYWNRQPNAFTNQIGKHLLKSVDYVAIDMNGFTPEQIAQVNQYIAKLPEADQARIVKVGF